VDDGFHVRGQTKTAPLHPILARFAMPGLVEGDDAVICGEHIDLILPELAVAAPTVQKHQGRVAFAADFTDDVQSVVGSNGLPDWLVGGFAADNGRRQKEAGDGGRHSGESRVHGQLLHKSALMAPWVLRVTRRSSDATVLRASALGSQD